MEPQTEWELTGEVLSAAIEVHRTLGPGFLESVYEEVLVVELSCRGIGHLRQVRVPIFYAGREIGFHRLDLLVEGAVVVELKAIKQILTEHILIVRSYMRAAGCSVGLLINFGRPGIEARRVYPHERRDP